MRLIAVGRMRPGPEADLFSRYASRLRPPLIVTEVPEGKGVPVSAKRQEAAGLLAALPPSAFAVAMDAQGPAPDSPALARAVERWLSTGHPVCFLIGGAEGHDAAVLQRADHVLSLGLLTWPHLLVRVMLAEQLFRAQSILSGHPYHRDGRPNA